MFKNRNLKFVLLGLCLIFPMLGKAVEGYKLVCDKPVYNFGHVDPSRVITNVFIIRNEGDLTFPLKFVRTSCSCTKGHLGKRMVGPGETVKLTAVFTAARRKGLQKKAILVMPINSDEPAIVLRMEGFVDVP